MFNKITSEYGSKNTSWKYNIPSTPSSAIDHFDSDGENSKIEADKHHRRSDKTEVDEYSETQLREKVKGKIVNYKLDLTIWQRRNINMFTIRFL